ncbi:MULTISPECIES: mycofactocin oligosaccharide methyltransferase MftM [Gordonia]|uniref:mycofactocin oligosaccharide methyltransferase MftM n=1 Tax=Gordonia TaxID=2053 RepID=UPI0007EAE75D|nr:MULTISPECIES: mycofactocin oligosaccharide methyltransferase MftM [unclassified Gordonia (in: high G+C Gram-positive bacteria)]OBC09773.1 methyltransferase type 11 [Gordonia sp. 852002-50395_SCH5434458]OBC11867.1 methyltransferase type 11 [Gordonia sp. 852002-50816_SCH5313054-a]OBC21660.1 methyltransferase type 11 [Gordonia sp. 852002-50816_SCH5313054-c]
MTIAPEFRSADTRSAGTPTTSTITVRRAEPATGDLAAEGFRRCGSLWWRRTTTQDGTTSVDIRHPFTSDLISDDVMVTALICLVEDGALAGQWEFEEAAVGLIRSSAASDDVAWASFYDNSLRDLVTGIASFSPVHRRARSLVSGSGVLEVGCCFGLFALQCAESGLEVSACDISSGAINLLRATAARRRTVVDAIVANATDLPFADDSVDTVTLIHLLEHLSRDERERALAEALRVARRRVIVAVPYEDEPSPHFGHLSCLRECDLVEWAGHVDHAGAEILDDHGGWLILTPRAD